ncbi:MAG: CapA family protein [Eubacteriales bacterium]|nr:CapA family protein [Eubacteriales bacterium]MDD3880960.1 CapA family protein [Eubacteriales bacterium]MDD4511971.1 CapA family protein [Eubacteriales bacterium]
MSITVRRLTALLLALMLPFAAFSAFAEDEDEEETLFTGRTQTALAQETPAPSSAPETDEDGYTHLLISCTGDVTIGGDTRKSTNIFEKELKNQNGDLSFCFRNVSDIFSQDDMTLVNFEGTLTTASVYKKGNDFVFAAPPSYVEVLTSGNIEAVSFENNHAMDYGEAGIEETTKTLTDAGIVYSKDGTLGIYEAKGIKIGMLSYQTFGDKYPELYERVPLEIADAKTHCDIVIVSYHWGNELDYYPSNNKQEVLAKLTIDSGADLVIGHHSHRINPIAEYNGKYICYSLGNFCFAGNSKPSDMRTYIFQTRFKISPDKEVEADGFRIIPCFISSKKSVNDFAPTPMTDKDDIDGLMDKLIGNGKKIDNAVTEYPLEWED